MLGRRKQPELRPLREALRIWELPKLTYEHVAIEVEKGSLGGSFVVVVVIAILMAKAITKDTTFDPLYRHSNGRGHTKESKYDSYVMASPIRMAIQRVNSCILCYGLRHSSGDTKGAHTHTHTLAHTQHVHACSNMHMHA